MSMGDGIVVLGHLKTFGDGTATLDAKYYTPPHAGSSWNTEFGHDHQLASCGTAAIRLILAAR